MLTTRTRVSCDVLTLLPAPPNPLQPIIDLLNQILGLLGG